MTFQFNEIGLELVYTVVFTTIFSSLNNVKIHTKRKRTFYTVHTLFGLVNTLEIYLYHALGVHCRVWWLNKLECCNSHFDIILQALNF